MDTNAQDLHNAPGHGWKHYFFEFFMLFLAVFCGFLAENWREHIIENKREGQFAGQLLSDLRKDSSFFNNRRIAFDSIFSEEKSMKSLLKHKQKLSDQELISAFFQVYWSFDVALTNTTFTQMKSSGALRYIQDIRLTSELQKYYDVMAERVISNAATVKDFATQYLTPWYMKHIRAQDVDVINNVIINPDAALINRSPETEQEILNITDTYRYYNLGVNEAINKPAAKQVDTLILMIKKEYHLE